MGKILDAIAQEQPDYVIQMGDLYDLYSFSKFPRTQNIYTPKRELELARAAAERFWAAVAKAAPKAQRIQLWGNHDDRAVKRVLENSPEHLHFIQEAMLDLMTFDGVDTQPDSRDELVIGDIWFMHGYLAGLGAHARYNQKKVVCAHTHHGGMLPIKLNNKIIWELNVGWVGNRHAQVCSYTAQKKMSRWTNGYGLIDPDRNIVAFCPVVTEAKR